MFRGVISRDEWGAQPPTSNAGPQLNDAGLVLHWEGPGMWGDLWVFAHNTCYDKVRGIQAYHQKVGYSDIAYNDVICPHGYVFQARSGLGMANAASGDWWVNQHAPAICFLWGLGDTVLENNPDPIDALNAVRNYGIAFAGLGLQVRPHRGVPGVSTMCPGDELAYVAGLLDGAPVQNVQDNIIPPPPGPAPDPVLALGDNNLAVASWQLWLNESGAGLVVDGQFGPATEAAVKSFQSFWKLHPSGIVDQATWNMRRWVENNVTNTSPPPSPVPTPIPPKPEPKPEPEPEPTPLPEKQRALSDKQVDAIIRATPEILEWVVSTRSRKRRLNNLKKYLESIYRDDS